MDELYSFFFFFNDTATTEIYTLSLHDALPICRVGHGHPLPRPGELHGALVHDLRAQDAGQAGALLRVEPHLGHVGGEDRKSTRLNSSHANISYAVFCLKKKKNKHL